ncbi:hypothetical protein SAMN04487895_1165 [Paenibacillus sophorae]|uniref:Uncharacterized protein n=1 Tax=Paenibacillus sophorae TaxID=1333845 RepID=A0A1H8U3V1_9BACL|nr:hypothetical protein [Paenibacillus sophorae]QWU17923.1 hypothetical protein KP014_12780 [Paenibacillus sophorae]SEO97523.1 hypothetical protein SAMN04487895_1165 [Paenibacillus sophorae]
MAKHKTEGSSLRIGVLSAHDLELAIYDVVLALSVVHHDAGVLHGSPQSFHP